MRQGTYGLMLLVSIVLLAVLFLAAAITCSVFGIPYQELPEYEEDSENTTESSTLQDFSCTSSVQFIASKWGSLMHGFMFFFMLGTVTYLIANIFRTSRQGRMYRHPEVFSLVVSVLMNFTFIFYFAWAFLWQNKEWIGSAVLLFLATGTSFSSMVVFSMNLSSHTEQLHHDSPVDLWIYRILVQNTLALTAVWTLCLFLMNFAVALVYDGHVYGPSASAGMIIVLNFLIAIWAPLDLMVWDRIFRYMLSPLPVLIWVLSSIYDRLAIDDCDDGTVWVYTIVLLISVLVVLVGRILLTVYRHLYKPLAKNQ